MSFFTKKTKYFLPAIVVLAAWLLFFGLNRADIQHDDAIYSFRAVGYLDYTDSQLQTTPIQWFGTIPWWSKLSFHDAPPLVFIIQHLFFSLFGVSVFTARLPFALAGLGSVVLLYLLARQIYNQKVAWISSLILTVFSYHIWASRVGYLEPIALFFILLTGYLFFVSLVDHKKFILFGISLGLTLLTKYTVFFLIPVLFFYLLLTQRKILASKYFVSSIAIAVLIFSPVIFYNLKVFQARGHFDLQFATLLGQKMSDWPGLAGMSGGSGNYLQQFFDFWQQFSGYYSLPIYILIVASILYLVVNFVSRYKEPKDLFLVLVILFASLEFSLIGSSVRFVSLLNPFFALVLALGLIKSFELINGNQVGSLEIFKKGFYFLFLAVVFGFEIFYSLNTNIFSQPLGEAGKYYSVSRWENGGFNQLNDYLGKIIKPDTLSRKSIASLDDLKVDVSKDLQGKDFFVYDPNLNWFSALWYFRQFSVYYGVNFVSAADLSLAIPNTNWFEFFKNYGVKNLYYI
ncbi:MAG: glycosyltransferase family 39 protein, partial [Patescibacteria group bacterium]